MVKFFWRAPDLSNKVCMLYYTTLLRPCGQLAWRILEKQCCRQCWIRRNGEKGSQMQRPKILTFNMESHGKTVTSWQTRNVKKQWRNNMRLQMIKICKKQHTSWHRRAQHTSPVRQCLNRSPGSRLQPAPGQSQEHRGYKFGTWKSFGTSHILFVIRKL